MTSKRTHRVSLAALLAAGLLAAPLFAGNTDRAPKPATTASAGDGGAARVDSPVKGPDAPSVLAGTDLERMLRRDSANLLMRKSRTGGTSIDVAGGFRSVLVVQVNADGKAVMSCIIDRKQAEEIFKPKSNGADQKEP